MIKEKSFLIVLAFVLFGCKDTASNVKELATKETQESRPVKKSKVKVTPISHATAVLEWENYTLYIDPVGGLDAFKGHKDPDLILITDIHGDHFSLKTLEELNTKKAKIVVPQAVADKIPENFTPQIDVLHNGDTKERFGILIEAIPMYNLREEALKFHTKGRGNGYVLNFNEERVYFSGDTEDIPEMRSLKYIDKAFVCMNLPYTMTEKRAADAVLAFQPKQVYPYHYRGNPNVSDVASFKAMVYAGNPDLEVIQLDWYPTEDY